MNDNLSRQPAITAFRSVIAASAAFFTLTIVAMLLYPGGRVGDRESLGYSFFSNFFSDLGQTSTYGGHANYPSLVLFCLALTATGIAVGVFFIAFSALFAGTSWPRRISIAAATFGVIAGVCFIGVAATPWNLYLQAHNEFVLWAFRMFLLAVICSGVACLLSPQLPRSFAYVYGAFAILLAAYIALLTFGPAPGTPVGAIVQATAQKIIVYASVLTIVIQAISVLALRPSR
ncbi:MAG: hypothetical protein ABI182_00540 [Candidatus Baltobacteraceae bacterium]